MPTRRAEPRQAASRLLPPLLGGLWCAALWAAAPAAAAPPPFGMEAVAPPGPAGAVTAPTGIDEVRGGASELVSDALAGPVDGALLNAQEPRGGDPGRGWTVVPSLGVQVLGTDNVRGTRNDRQADLITNIAPELLVTVDTARLQGRLSYAPVVRLHAFTSDQDRLDHLLNGQVLASIVPGSLFLDLRGNAATQATSGGFSPEGAAVVDRTNRVQTTTVQVSPYWIGRFGGLATAQIGYAFQHAEQDGDRAFVPGAAQPFFTSQDFTAHEGFAVLRSGEDFGRLALEGRVDGTTYSGSGVFNDAHRAFATLEARYALWRGVAVLVEGGYEDQRYAGTRPFQIQDAIWTVGMRFDPAPESVIIVKYGHRDGFDAASLQAGVNLGGRTRLVVSYSDRLGTGTSRRQDLLTATSVDALGNPVNTLTGASLRPSNSLLAVQSGLFRIRNFEASISRTASRDTFTLSVLHEQQIPITTELGTATFGQRGTSGTLSWAHELTPRTNLIASAQYGRYTSPLVRGSGDVFTATAGLNYSFEEGLVGTLRYILTNSGSAAVSGNGLTTDRGLQNVVLLGLRKTF